jgi:uncharacterized cupredoxin-like copper-binding protein
MAYHNPIRVAAAAALIAAAFALPACGGSDEEDTAKDPATKPSTPAPANEKPRSTIKVVEAEYSLKDTPAKGTTQGGKITFDVENAGAIPHEFVVIKTNKKADALLKGDEADETGNVGEIGNIDPGRSKKLKLKVAPGHYALICNLPGHYMPSGKPGMLADFTVQ